jgi:hypothetical protein
VSLDWAIGDNDSAPLKVCEKPHQDWRFRLPEETGFAENRPFQKGHFLL